MAPSTSTVDFRFPSHDGRSTVHGIIWQPTGVPLRGIVQLIHGMAEHIERYDRFARFLAAHGYVVCGHDHIGHGHSVASRDELGHLPAREGADVLVEDVDTVRSLVGDAFADLAEGPLPHFAFGHSMGSYTLRVYLTRHGHGLAGAVLCGTGHPPLAASVAGNLLARGLGAVKGERAKSELVHSLADGAFSRAVEDPRTPFDWVSASQANVDAYLADDLNGFPFTLGGYASLTRLTALAASLELAKAIPHDLPLLFIAGAEDPVGDNGRGVRAAADLMRRAGAEDVKVILYKGMRHEILNEERAQRVFDDVLAWLDAHDPLGAPEAPTAQGQRP